MVNKQMTGEFYLYLNIFLTFIIVTHIFRTNRPKYWVFVILISGTLGAIIYFIFEILPEHPAWEHEPAMRVRPLDITIFWPFLIGP